MSLSSLTSNEFIDSLTLRRNELSVLQKEHENQLLIVLKSVITVFQAVVKICVCKRWQNYLAELKTLTGAHWTAWTLENGPFWRPLFRGGTMAAYSFKHVWQAAEKAVHMNRIQKTIADLFRLNCLSRYSEWSIIEYFLYNTQILCNVRLLGYVYVRI